LRSPAEVEVGAAWAEATFVVALIDAKVAPSEAEAGVGAAVAGSVYPVAVVRWRGAQTAASLHGVAEVEAGAAWTEAAGVVAPSAAEDAPIEAEAGAGAAAVGGSRCRNTLGTRLP